MKVMFIAAVAVGLGFAQAAASETPPETLPLFAALPVPAATPAGTASVPGAESLYRGLYVGTEVFGVGGHGVRGGFGGDAYGGYERRLDSGALVGLEGATGYGPAILRVPGLKGFEFGEASARIAYPMGRFTPFLAAGLVVAKPVTGGALATSATEDLNGLLNGGDLYAAPRIGAGVAYQLTQNTSVAVGLSVGRGLGTLGGFP